MKGYVVVGLASLIALSSCSLFDRMILRAQDKREPAEMRAVAIDGGDPLETPDYDGPSRGEPAAKVEVIVSHSPGELLREEISVDGRLASHVDKRNAGGTVLAMKPGPRLIAIRSHYARVQL